MTGRPGHDRFLGVTGPVGARFDRLAVTVTSEEEFLHFLEAMLADDDLTDWSGRIEDYLDAVLAWLRSDEGRQRMAAYPNTFAAMAAVFYAGLREGQPGP